MMILSLSQKHDLLNSKIYMIKLSISPIMTMFKDLYLESNIIVLQEGLQRLKEGDIKSHALMILPNIISRYYRKSEIIQNPGYYIDHFDLFKQQVMNALNCLESGGILKRKFILNMMNQDKGDIVCNIMDFSNYFNNLICQQRFGKQTQGETQ